MREWHTQLQEVNDDLINSYNIRCSNHNELLEILKQINLTIQKAARLRGEWLFYEIFSSYILKFHVRFFDIFFFPVGQNKADVVNLSRSALQSNNLHSLLKIVRTGEA